jgi:hypothetical protein
MDATRLNPDQLIQSSFLLVLSACSTVVIAFLSKLVRSIEKLNLQMAQLLERVAWHEKEIDNHAERLTHLETKKGEN